MMLDYIAQIFNLPGFPYFGRGFVCLQPIFIAIPACVEYIPVKTGYRLQVTDYSQRNRESL